MHKCSFLHEDWIRGKTSDRFLRTNLRDEGCRFALDCCSHFNLPRNKTSRSGVFVSNLIAAAAAAIEKQRSKH